MPKIAVPVRTIVFFTAVAALAVAGGVVYAYLPNATITLTPARVTRSATQTITLHPDADQSNFEDFRMPAEVLERTASAEKTITRSEAGAREDYATGTVTLVNEQRESQDILPKSRLRHDETGTIFLTDSPVRIPADGRVSMNITAQEKGAQGDVPPGHFTFENLPEDLQEQVYATSDEPTSGGSVIEEPLSEDELTRAITQVEEHAREKAIGKLMRENENRLANDDLVRTETIETTSSAQPGSKAGEYTVRAEVRARGFVINESDLLNMAILALRPKAEADERFVEYHPDSFSTELTSVQFEQSAATIKAELTGTFAKRISAGAKQAAPLAGKTESEVIEHFRQFDDVADVDVSFSPFWVDAVPAREGATAIEVRSMK